MELPNYRLPSAASVLRLMWEKAKDFLTRAFTVIFVASIIIWFLQTFDARLNVVTDSSTSCWHAGRLIAPLFAPLASATGGFPPLSSPASLPRRLWSPPWRCSPAPV